MYDAFVTIGVTFLLCFTWPQASLQLVSATEQAQPPYAKWGRLAMLEAQKKYPHAQIIEYLHLGRTAPSTTTSMESFKLLLRQDNRIRAVYVRILFETATEKLLSVKMEEADG